MVYVLTIESPLTPKFRRKRVFVTPDDNLSHDVTKAQQFASAEDASRCAICDDEVVWQYDPKTGIAQPLE